MQAFKISTIGDWWRSVKGQFGGTARSEDLRGTAL